jgi:hypothetical protein
LLPLLLLPLLPLLVLLVGVCRQQLPGVLVLQGVFYACDDGMRVL